MEAIVAKHFKPDKVDEFKKRLALVKDLVDKKFTTADDLHAAHSDLISRSQAENILKKTNVQKGGVNGSTDFLTDTISGAITGLTSVFIPEFRAPLQLGLGVVFLLNYIEKLPMFGSIVGAALDMTAATLPITAVNIQTSVPLLFSLIPLPYMNFVGMAVGWFFSAMLLFVAIMIGVSRMQFGAAIEASAGLIPVVGTSAMNFVRTSNTTLGKLNQKRQKVVADFLEVVDVLKQTSQSVGRGLSDTLDNVASEAKAAASSTAKSALQTVVSEVKTASATPAPAPAPASVGGKKKRFSRKKPMIKKWKTTRRIKSARR
jgi:hypothetical protein